MENYANKQCINNHSGIEIAECNECSQNCETEMECSTIQNLDSIPKPSSNPQVCNIPGPLPQSDNMNQEASESSFPEDDGEQERVRSQ